MRSVINYMLTFILLIGSIASYAQQGTTITDKRGGHWIVGLDAGVAWQQSDVKTRHGGGWGFNIGKNLFYRETSPISLDLRGRYMGTWTYGLNSESTLLSSMDSSYLNAAPVFKQYDSTSYVFHNHKTEFHDLALELRLNLENLRRKTNVHLGLYAGLGLGFYNSTFEHLDLTDNPYDYESINQNQTPSKICSDIKDLWQLNRDYESAANIKEDFNVTVTPSIGLELGYWFSPGFMMGVGHRTTFTLQDDFEGVIQDNGAGINSAIHHYTNLFLTANIYGKKKRVDVDCPDINFNYPSSNNGSFTTDQQTVVVRATVKNVSRNELTFSINGNTSQNYSLGSNDFEAAVNLQAGSNIITIKGTNECGTNAQNITIVYNPQKDPEQPPVVTITNPANSPTTVNSSTIDINATIQYVSSSSDVTFTVNGQPSRNFTFSGTSFRANNVNLKIGSNVITVTGSNSVGSDSKSVIINYQKDRQPPIVDITFPSTSPYNSDASTINIVASIQHVSNANDVTFSINGQNSRSFTFNGTSFMANNVQLNKGSNVIIVTGRNTDGQDAETVIINYKEQPKPAPVVTITYPSNNPFNTNINTVNISATIQHVASSSDVTFNVNGQNNRNFSFNGTSFTANNINLNPGSNTFTITGRNTEGSDTKSTVVIYKQPEPAPVVTITNPRANPYTSQNNTVNITATILNVTGKSNVTFSVNGMNNGNFNFSGTNFNANNINLRTGSNTVTITGRNNSGQDTKSTVIIYQPAPKPGPIVTITSPIANPHNTQNSTINITATILNVTSKNDVTFTANGQNLSNFNFNGTSFSASNIRLKPGSNTFTITGRNAQGQDTKSTVVIYTQALPPPVVTITNPRANPHTSQNNTVNITATILNVASQNDVTFNVNGMNNSNFSFSGTNFNANNINLRTGSNTVTITGRNNSGQDTKSTIIIYQPAPKPGPIVTITSPIANPHNTQNSTINITATILNVTSKNDVTFTANGQNLSNFNFNGTSFSASNIRLKPGSNTFTITGRNAQGQDTKSTVVIYTQALPPPVVTITIPRANPYTITTNTTNIAATILNVANRNDVTFNINGQTSQNFTFNGTSFTANNVNLNTGSNTIVITGRNSSGQDSKSTVIIYNKPVSPPTVTITNPRQNPYTTQNNTSTITATITNVANKNGVTFTVNGINNSNFSFTGTNFVANNMNLNVGSNTFTIKGQNSSGQDVKSTIIIYAPVPKPKPLVTITYPVANPFNTTQNSTNVNATILNVAGVNDVTFTVNGQNSRNFSFNGTSFTANNISLNQGSNTFTITGRNPQGTDTKSTVVVYNKPIPKPTVTITSPRQNPYTTTQNNININATITNVAGANDVTFTVNGQANRNFSFNGTSFIANNIKLNTGSNTFTITGRNSAGQDSKSTVVIYSKPTPKPVVTITSPLRNPYTLSTNIISIKATILNVAGMNDVTFTVNGQNSRSFSFSGTSFTASNITLNPGSNTFTIMGRNSAGQDSKSTVIIYNKPTPKPTVRITYPNTNPFNTAQNSTNINATITNVAGANDVTFTVNGQASRSFSFNGTSFTANNINLNQGSNTFTITGRNSNGQDSKSTVVVYAPKVNPPKVTITNPRQNPFNTQTNTTNIAATIINVANASDVTFTVNGVNTRTFNFSGTSFTANGLRLNPGNNIFTISGRNSAGQDTRSTTIVYTLPKPKPIVTITSPRQNPHNTQVNKVTVTATILNVANANDVTFTINGTNNRNFNFSGTTFTASNVSLNPGRNTFVITGRNSAGQDSKTTAVIYSVPIPKPIVTITNPIRSPFNTTTASFAVKATILNISGVNDITFTQNGQNSRNFTYTGKSFNSNAKLVKGNNTFVITGRNSAGQDSKTTVVVYNPPIQLKPIVKITQPAVNPFNTTAASANIRATIMNVSSARGVKFTVNGQNNTNFSFSGMNFSANNISLNPGNNTITITGTNENGQDTKSTAIIYTAPQPKPIVTITAPRLNPYTSQVNTANIRATILNVASASNVTFSLNGQALTNFSFTGTSFAANSVPLSTGNNTFSITGRNNAGQDTKTTVVIYNPAPSTPKPVVTYTAPTQNPMNTQSSRMNIAGTITNVATASGVTFTHNGQAVTNFMYTNGTFLARNITLRNGANTLVLKGTNSAGSDSKTTVVNYSTTNNNGGSNTGNTASLPPIILFTAPMQNSVTTNIVTVKCNVANMVSNALSQFEVTVNGVRVTNFTFAGTKLTLPNVRLNSGNNTISIKATNSKGSDTKTKTISLLQSGGGGRSGGLIESPGGK